MISDCALTRFVTVSTLFERAFNCGARNVSVTKDKFKFKLIYSHLFSYNITTIKNKKEVKKKKQS